MEKRYLIAKVIASVATICSVVGVIMNIAVGGVFSNTLMGIGVLGALISYVFGGLLKAISNILNLASWGLVAAGFPWNLVAVAFSGIAAFVVMLLMPIIPVSQAAREWA